MNWERACGPFFFSAPEDDRLIRMKNPITRRAEAGSIIMWIFVGILLLAALSFTVSRMMQGGGDGGKRENATLAASEVAAYGQRVRQAVHTLRIAGTCADTDISFENDFLSGYAHSPAVSASCLVFAPSGGSAAYAAPEDEWLDTDADLNRDWRFTAADEYQDVGTTCAGDSCADLAMILWPVKKTLCTALNDLLGVDNPGGDPPVDTGLTGTVFTGAYAYTATIGDEAGGEPLKGRMAGCFTGTGTGLNYFYQILTGR